MQKEKIVEIKNCKKCFIKFEITDKDLEFYNKISPKIWWEKFQIPTPKLCPECREQRRLIWRNERKLYKRKCDGTGKEIVSIYSPDKKYKVYEQDFWWSDKWDSLDYGKEFDFEKGFFKNFSLLFEEVPRLWLFNINPLNSPYCHNTDNNKNCYLCFWMSHSQNSYYAGISTRLTDCMDVFVSWMSSNLYNAIDCVNVHNGFFVSRCQNSNFLKYCVDCIWCENCLFSFWLRNKKYFILNEEYKKWEYLKKLKEIFSNKEKFNNYYKKYQKLLEKFPRVYAYFSNCENCSWNTLLNCKNSFNCYDSIWLEDCKNIDNSWWWANCYDCYWLTSFSEWVLESLSIKWSYCYFCFEVFDSSYLYYCINCYSCENCFGCVWLKNKKYCILNKQYTKEEYENLVPKIIKYMQKTWEWWEFFPASISPFWYNETIANEYYPLEKEEALKQCFNWSDYEAPFPKVEKIIPAKLLPENVKDIPDDILNRAIECEKTKKPFRIIKQELEFYRKHNLPIPRKHPDVRHLERLSLRNPRKLYDRKCDKCEKDIKTTYSLDRSEIVYCKECYLEEIM